MVVVIVMIGDGVGVCICKFLFVELVEILTMIMSSTNISRKINLFSWLMGLAYQKKVDHGLLCLTGQSTMTLQDRGSTPTTWWQSLVRNL